CVNGWGWDRRFSTVHQVVGSSGYRWRARELQNGESKDTPTQRYCIEVDSPYDAATLSKIPTRKDYGGRMVGRLSPQDKDLYEKEVAKYVDKGWWRVVGPVTTTPYSSSALVVFPVRSRKPGASTPIRPVLDARLRNIHGPASSYEGPCIDAILLNIRLRWHPQSRVLTRDASSAFYRVRMSPSSMVELLADGMVYHSWRLCFGLRAGPCCLWSALTFVLDVSIAELPADMRSRLFGCAFYLYLDDLTLVIDGGADPESSLAETIISKVVEVAARYGFDFPEIKGYDSVSIHRFKHLGIWWEFDEGDLSFSCPKFTLGTVKNAQGEYKTSWTRRELYSVAACVSSGCDPLLIHGKERLAGDVLKILCGYVGKNKDWDESSEIDTRGPSYKVLCSCIKVIEDHVKQQCHHPVQHPDQLEVHVDASSIGWAWAMFGVSTVTGDSWLIQSAAGVFKTKNQRSSHINRKELAALAKAMVAVHAALSGKRQRPLIPLVKVCCDSQTVVRWTASNGIRSSSKSLERVIVRRLIQSIREIMDDLRSVGVNFKLEKVTSEDNRADSLSRAASDWGFDQLEISDPSDDAALFPASEAIHAVQGDERDKCAQPDLPVGATAREAVRSLQEKSPLWSKVVVYLKTGGKADPKVLHAAQEKRIDSEGLLVALRYPGGSTLQSPREVIVIPCDFDEGKAEALRIIKVFHESTHHNARYLSWEVSRFFLIDGLARLARLVCQGCERCQNAITTRFYAGAMGFTDTTAACVWDVVACDIAGPFKPDKDYGFVAALGGGLMIAHTLVLRPLLYGLVENDVQKKWHGCLRSLKISLWKA
ncbi:hypothetical protein FOL46_001464, partial [Perkinsus olseni]